MSATDKLSSRDQSVLAAMDTQALAEAFCAWPLPASVCSDPCASMTPAQGYTHPRFGTNLLTVAEAKAMFDHLVERGLLQIDPARHTADGPRKALLAMEITGGKLEISIGVEALAVAVEGGPMFEDGTKVTDPDLFAKELLQALQDEDEQGTNPIHRAIDAAAEAAVEWGAEGIRLPEDEDDA